MNRNISHIERVLLLGCVIIILTVGTFVGHAVKDVFAGDENSDKWSELKVFTDVLAIVKRDYVEDVTNKKLVDGAIRGMLSSLDPHSGYLDPDYYQDLQVQTKGHFGGLGIEITINKRHFLYS